MKSFWIASALAVAFSVTAVNAKDDNHSAPKNFATISAGLSALDAVIADAKSKVAAGNFEALHDTSENLDSVADGLGGKISDVAADAKDRFKFNVDQLQNLHDQLDEAHHDANKLDAERVIKRLEDVAARLKALAPK